MQNISHPIHPDDFTNTHFFFGRLYTWYVSDPFESVNSDLANESGDCGDSGDWDDSGDSGDLGYPGDFGDSNDSSVTLVSRPRLQDKAKIVETETSLRVLLISVNVVNTSVKSHILHTPKY